MEKFKKILPSLIFNIAETIVVILMGMLLKLPISHIILIITVFIGTRGLLKGTIHFKTWYRCLIWSVLIMLSLIVLLKVNVIVSIVFAIFAAFIMTGKADVHITNMYLWKGVDEPSKYQDIIDYIKYNELDTVLMEFENKIKMKNELEYLIYRYRFKEGKTFAEISELLNGMDNPRIVEHLDKISFAIRLYCEI